MSTTQSLLLLATDATTAKETRGERGMNSRPRKVIVLVLVLISGLFSKFEPHGGGQTSWKWKSQAERWPNGLVGDEIPKRKGRTK
jgi:hypothetical protein